MFRQKNTAAKIQEVLDDTWIEPETGIYTNIRYAEIMGTSGQGDLRVNYATLKKIFGKASIDKGNGRGSKIRKEWIIKIDGMICTIYDWKQGGIPFKDTRWSVGGSHPICRRLVQSVIDAYLLTGIPPKVIHLEGDPFRC